MMNAPLRFLFAGLLAVAAPGVSLNGQTNPATASASATPSKPAEAAQNQPLASPASAPSPVAAPAPAPIAIENATAPTLVIPIKGEISKVQFFFLRRALKEAERDGVGAVVLDMDTYGGDLEACVEIQKALASSRLRTITYINPNAGSAGALIAISTREIYMAPVSAIGAAAPVAAGGQELPETIRDKTDSFFSNYFVSAAKENGHNPDIVLAFMDKNKELVVGGQKVHEKGSVLTLSAQEAVRVIDGKPLLAAGIAADVGAVLKAAHLGPEFRRVEPTGFERLAFWIITLAPLFLLGGILGVYLEFKMPGTLIPGICGAVCFVIFFAGHYVAGLAGWEAPALFIVGAILVISELAIAPGTILPGLAGLFMVVIGLVWAMVDHYPGSPLKLDTDALLWPLANFALAVVLAVIAALLLARFLPDVPFFNRLVLSSEQPDGPALPPLQSEFTRLAVGDTGVADSILRPSGRAKFGGEPFDVISKGEFIDPGTPIHVSAVEGARIVVERL